MSNSINSIFHIRALEFGLICRIKPNFKKFNVYADSKEITFELKSKAEQGKANDELMNYLNSVFEFKSKHGAYIAKGLKDSRKHVVVNLENSCWYVSRQNEDTNSIINSIYEELSGESLGV